MPAYLDYNATARILPQAREALLRHIDDEFGNAGSRTHEFGMRAKQSVEVSRRSVASLAAASADEVIFTSGATEANNIAILGLAEFGRVENRRHIITSTIEHKAILEPLDRLKVDGFDVTEIPVGPSGRVDPQAVVAALRPDTLLISIMQANNETGVLQPIGEVANGLGTHPAYFHVDAAQGYGKTEDGLSSHRIDLISISAHKVFAPRGVGALVARRRGLQRPPLKPLMFGGGQERGLRPGTLPVPLIAAFGAAAQAASTEGFAWRQRCSAIRQEALTAFAGLRYELIGDQTHIMPHVLSIGFTGVDSEALMLALKDLAAFSNGSACTSAAYEPSHVLSAMGLEKSRADEVVRMSWSHLSDDIPWAMMANRIADLQPSDA